jgi:hypothetical protein
MSNQLTGSTGPLYARDIAGGFGVQVRGTLVFPATVNVADPAALTDNLSAMLSVDASGRLRVVLSGPAPAGTISVQPAVLADSVGVTGRAVAPGAGVVVATITPAAGTYDIEVRTNLDAGAPAAAEINNMDFREGGVVVSVLIVSPVLHTNVAGISRFRRVLDGATAITVNAVAAATAAVGYSAQITAIRVA